jgi:DsbC/DsbD-like thiol-disulfide interchange protein
MLRRIALSIISTFLLVVLSACSRSASAPASATVSPGSSPSPPTSSVKFVKVTAPDNVQIAAGGSAETIVHIVIQRGYHTNANPPTYSYLKPTELIITTNSGISVGFIAYPNPTAKKFPFADKPLAVYEGDVPVKVMLKAAQSNGKGAHSLPAKVNVQACDDQVCYPPGTIELSIPVAIK